MGTARRETRTGGRSPACVVREISEETGWQVTTGPLLDCWQYHICEGRDVVVVTYGCNVLSTKPPAVSGEHKRAALFGPGDVPHLIMPDGYKRSILAWFSHLNEQATPADHRSDDLARDSPGS